MRGPAQIALVASHAVDAAGCSLDRANRKKVRKRRHGGPGKKEDKRQNHTRQRYSIESMAVHDSCLPHSEGAVQSCGCYSTSETALDDLSFLCIINNIGKKILKKISFALLLR